MRFPEKNLILAFSACILILALWSILLFIANQKTTDLNYIYNVAVGLMFASGGGIAFLGIWGLGIKNALKKELLTVGIGMSCFGMGYFVWSFYNLALRIETPFPSLADAFFALYTPCVTYGVINLLRVFGVMIPKKIYLQSLGIYLVAVIFIFSVGNPPDLSPSLPILTKAVNMYYLLGDSLLITLSIMLIRLTRGRIHNSFIYFVFAMLAMASGDFVFSYRTASGAYWNGDISDFLFGLGAYLFSIGIIKIIATQYTISKSFSS